MAKKKEIITVTCPTCKSTIKYVKGDPPRRCITCTTEAEVKNEASRLALKGVTVVQGGVLKVKAVGKGGK